MSRPRLIALSLAFITLLVYSPVTRQGFLNLDDDLYVTSNRVVQSGLTWGGAKWALVTWHASNWHPLTWLSHMLDCQLFGLEPAGHHSTNVLFHTANSVILMLLLLRLTGALWPSSLVAALFAWHPLFVESAAWIAERKNVLSTFFGLLTLLIYTRWVQNRSAPQSRGHESKLHLWSLDYALALLFFALSLMSKPMLVTLPFVMLLLDYWPLRRSPQSACGLAQFRRLALEKWPFFVLVVAECVITFLAQRTGGMVALLQRVPLNLRVCNAFRSYVLYLWKAVWPAKLTILYPYPPENQLLVAVLPAAAILVGITWLVWRVRQRNPYLLVGWLWFLGTLVPMIGLVQVGGQAMNDHHAYFPLIGIFIAVAFGLKDFIARYQIGVVPPAVVAALILGSILIVSEHQLTYWRNDEALFSHALAITNDNGPAHNNLGVALAKQGRYAEAQAHFQEAIRLNSLWADPRNNLGNLLRIEGKPQEALVEYSQAVQLKPRHPIMRAKLGEVLAELGRFDEALSQLQEAARLDPAYAWAHFQMARVLLQLGRDAEAIGQCREALKLDPNNFQILVFTAHVLAANENPTLRDGKTALALASRASAMVPDEPHVLDVLAMAFAETADFTNAKITVSNAIQLATSANVTNLESLQERLELYKKQQAWRESFLFTNPPAKETPGN